MADQSVAEYQGRYIGQLTIEGPRASPDTAGGTIHVMTSSTIDLMTGANVTIGSSEKWDGSYACLRYSFISELSNRFLVSSP